MPTTETEDKPLTTVRVIYVRCWFKDERAVFRTWFDGGAPLSCGCTKVGRIVMFRIGDRWFTCTKCGTKWETGADMSKFKGSQTQLTLVKFDRIYIAGEQID